MKDGPIFEVKDEAIRKAWHMIKISVIIPVFNEEKYLMQCLDSVCNQTMREIEIICIDDGSTDSSLSILQRCAEADSRIKVLTQNNQFAGAARNRGMECAKGRYLSFLDSDDYFEPDMLEKMYRRAEERRADVVLCRYAEYIDGENSVIQKNWSFENMFFKEKEIFNGNSLHCAGIFQITKGWAWDKLFRTDFVRKNGYQFSDFHSSEDGFFVYMLLARADVISYMDDVLVTHRVNNQLSLSHSKDEDWRNGFRMWLLIKQELEKQKLYDVYKQSFLNELLYFLSWYLDSMNTEDAYRNCYQYIQQQMEPEYEILSYGKDKFFQTELFDWYEEVILTR